METLRVDVGTASCPIHILRKASEWAEALEGLALKGPVILLSSPRVSHFCLKDVKKSLTDSKIPFKTLLLPDGEKSKNLSTVAKAYRELVRLGADRSTPILIVGGGVLGDMGGLVAATFLRGLPFVHVPTTLMAQVDSSIGGKLGIDIPEGKNLVGVFRQPQAIISYIPFLRTLPRREILGGLAEVLKYGVIEDPNLFQLVLKEKEGIFEKDPEILHQIVLKSAAIKARVVSSDEKEGDLRMILNFGHTFGHAIERLTRYRRFTHGEAVSIGMAVSAQLSAHLGHCRQEEADALRQAIYSLGLPLTSPSFPRRDWIRALMVDKKSRQGMIHFVFLKRLGEVFIQKISPEDLVKHAWTFLKSS